ncbi:heavy-metal-associated domain-containing protein [Altererythrobacter aerius]|uniref:Heavy-metal-associated domain-containing protein n=1 Tax=Tsuneonella aeria TaxID=1837929 RepID=A0A6I4TAY5_9SPHN|nr:heavy-metal-associated domain-containing protein [Tsuneonella aeria]MXO74481.1 heavy-metal-associated domain-containing protein [Tsuneonella aeria]
MMAFTHLSRNPRRATVAAGLALAGAALAALGANAIWAQIAGDRGIAAVAASGDIHVRGVEVDVTGKDAADARDKGWQEAMRLAWKKIGGPSIPDGQLFGLVSSVVVESEQLGPTRYVARLGVVFDRARAGGLLGRGEAIAHSAPMLLVPVTYSGGTQTVYERRNPWQRAWAEYQPGASRIDYVRPSGSGGDSLLLTAGQVNRRSRTWWRNVLDQFGASDVLVAIARLEHQYPGGPVRGEFTARHGPDNTYLASFTLTAPSQEALPEMLDQAVQRFNAIYEQALADGKLAPDPTLALGEPQIDPAIQQMIELGRLAGQRDRAAEAAARRAREAEKPAEAEPANDPETTSVVNTYAVEFLTPDAASFDDALAGARGAVGVRSATPTSTAVGGTSVMTIAFGGTLSELATALRARGFTVRQTSNSLVISR